jgi:acyl-CoA synthetase (AMP-forming)/AMP-acid ligase II
VGLRPKDHIAILMENNREYLEIVFACIVAGLAYTSISTHLTVPEIEYIVNDSEAKIFVTSAGQKDLVKDLLGRIPNVKHRISVGGGIDGCLPYAEAVAKYPATPIPEDLEGRDMLYSSGTTGRPKGIVGRLPDMPFGQIASMVMINAYKLTNETIYISPAPLYHSAPLRWCVWTVRMGGTVIIMDHFDPEWSLALIEKYRATHSQWVPTMFIRMLKLPEEIRRKYDVSSMKIAVHAAAPCPIQVKEQMIEWWGPVIYEYYAGTEGNTMLAISPQEWMTHKGSVGRCFVGTMHVLDDNENEMPLGEPGVVYIENGYPFEYHNDPEKTKSAQTSKGWTTLGDIGYVDKDGYLYLTDRKADMIISGGVNIYPQEAENVLVTHPKVMDAAVFGVPNPDFGEEVKAIVQPRNFADAGPALEQELLAFCQQNLSKIKCPRTIDFEQELPRTPTGKLLKRILKERYKKA